MKYMCPICGYPELDEPAYHGNEKSGLGSLEYCPSCVFQFGWHDDDQHITHEQWRQQWITKGMPWGSKGVKPPADWNPRQQLLNIGIKI